MMVHIIAAMLAGAAGALIVINIMATKLFNKLVATEKAHMDEILQITEQAINKLYKNTYRNL